MGLTIEAGINDFLLEKAAQKDKMNGKSLLMLGKQNVCIDPVNIFLLADRLGLELKEDEIHADTVGNIKAEAFFRSLGIGEIHVMDISDYEGADIIHDLNEIITREDLFERFDYIVDGGTLEHVFNLASAMKNITRMLKIQGKIFHYLPASSWINHGFYSISPCLLNDFYRCNGFEVISSNIVLRAPHYQPDKDSSMPQHIEDCLATGIDYRMMNLIDARFDLLHQYKGNLRCIAQKVTNVDFRVPVQRHWYEHSAMKKALVKGLCLSSYQEGEILVWGMGNTAKRFLAALSEVNFPTEKIAGVTAKERSLAEYLGYLVIDSEKLDISKIKVIIIAAVEYEDEIYRLCKRKFGDSVRYIKLRKYSDFFMNF